MKKDRSIIRTTVRRIPELICPGCGSDDTADFDTLEVTYPDGAEVIVYHYRCTCGIRFKEIFKRVEICKE